MTKNSPVTIRRDSRQALTVAGVLAAVTFVLYWPAGQFDFVEYDDSDYVFENVTVREGLTGWGVVWAFVDAHASNWHPVTWISHMLDCQLFGLNAGAHHLVNAGFHAANAALLFLVFRCLTSTFWRSALVAALFAWHPLRVESVAWVSERKDVLSGFFFLLTILAYAEYTRLSSARLEAGKGPGTGGLIRTLAPGSPRRILYALSLVLFILGLLSKPMLVTVPFVLLLLDFWPLARLRIVSGRTALKNAAPLLVEKAPFFILAVLVGIITILSQRSSQAMIPLRSEGIGSRLDEAVAGYAQYLGKFFWPENLSVIYLLPRQIPMGTLIPAFVLLLIISWGVMRLKRPYLAVGWLWFVGMLLPVSGLFQAGLQSIADRYTYLPGIGLGIMLAWGIAEILDLTLAAVRVAARWVAGATAVLVLSACAILSRRELSYWRNTETLMTRAREIDPRNYVACENLAKFYSRHGQTEKAREMRERSIELDPVFQNRHTVP